MLGRQCTSGKFYLYKLYKKYHNERGCFCLVMLKPYTRLNIFDKARGDETMA